VVVNVAEMTRFTLKSESDKNKWGVGGALANIILSLRQENKNTKQKDENSVCLREIMKITV